MFQQRQTDPTGTNPNGVWVNPLASLAHNVPLMIRKAICLASDRLEKDPAYHIEKDAQEEVLGRYAVALAKFIKIASADPTIDKFMDAYRASGLQEIPAGAKVVFDSAFSHVVLQLYMQFVREALHKGDKAIGVKELLDITDLKE